MKPIRSNDKYILTGPEFVGTDEVMIKAEASGR